MGDPEQAIWGKDFIVGRNVAQIHNNIENPRWGSTKEIDYIAIDEKYRNAVATESNPRCRAC